jgi:hypothetical protein
MKPFLFVLFLSIAMLITQYPTFAESGEGDGGNNNGYQGPRQLSSAQTNITGGCNCGTTVSGAASKSSLVFKAALGAYVAYHIYERRGRDDEVIVDTVYENVVTVIEIERIGDDLYINATEVREADVSSFIAGQNQPDNTYQVISAADYEGGLSGEGVDALAQVIELPPAETYNYVLFEEPGGSITDITGLTIDLAENELPPKPTPASTTP